VADDRTLDLPASDQVAAAITGAPGELIGRFEITARLGEGAMGVVFAARDPALGRRVAIKVLRSANDRPAYRDRLLREARAIALIDHPNVIRIHEVGTDRDRLFVVMELVEGTTLATYLRAERPPWRTVLALYGQAGNGLSAIHRRGLVHRDFKPENVLVDHGGHVRVADFGLARLDSEYDADASLQARMVTLTSTGMQLGTPGYMAPEQIAGAEVDARADQYAFCVALRAALTGHDAPVAVHDALARGTAELPDERFASIDELLAALAAGAAPSRRTAWIAVPIAIVGLAAIATAIVIGTSSSKSPPVHATSAMPAPSAVVVVVDAALPPAPLPAPPAIAIAPTVTTKDRLPAMVVPHTTVHVAKPTSARDQALREAAVYDDATARYAMTEHLRLTTGSTAAAAAHPTPFADLTSATWPAAPFDNGESPNLDRYDIAPSHLKAVRAATAALGRISNDDIDALHAALDAATDDPTRARLRASIGAAERLREDYPTAREELGAAKTMLEKLLPTPSNDAHLLGQVELNLVLCDLSEGHGIDAAIYLAQHQPARSTNGEHFEWAFARGIAEWETGLASGKDKANRARADEALRPIITAYAKAVRMIP
jgi:serine/threonine-protein kinase